MTLFASKFVTLYSYGDSIQRYCYAELFVLQRRVYLSTDFLSLALKHLIVHSCGAPCTTVVPFFFGYASRVAYSSPSAGSWGLAGGAPLVAVCCGAGQCRVLFLWLSDTFACIVAGMCSQNVTAVVMSQE